MHGYINHLNFLLHSKPNLLVQTQLLSAKVNTSANLIKKKRGRFSMPHMFLHHLIVDVKQQLVTKTDKMIKLINLHQAGMLLVIMAWILLS